MVHNVIPLRQEAQRIRAIMLRPEVKIVTLASRPKAPAGYWEALALHTGVCLSTDLDVPQSKILITCEDNTRGYVSLRTA